MPRFRIDLSYKGTRYHGWQIQSNANTVQAELNRALFLLLGEAPETTGCGRTDTGVHAHAYTAHFDCTGIESTAHAVYKLNCILPNDIAIKDIGEVRPDFHARFGAVKRTYKYFIHQEKTPFLNEFSYFFPRSLNLQAMNLAAATLLGKHDFTSFCKSRSDVKTGFCTIYEAGWAFNDNGPVFTISADRFLRNMVRAVTGTMLEIGTGRSDIEDFVKIIALKDRREAGVSVPPQGLFLWETEYPNPISNLV